MGALENLSLLRAILEGDEPAAQLACGTMTFDAQQFRRFVTRHQLGGTAYRQIRETGSDPFLSPETLEHFKLHYLKQWGRNEQLLRETVRLRDALDAASIAHCFLKGVLLASRYYGDVDARYTRDIDLMVAAEDRRRAGELLVACGFRRQCRVPISDAVTVPFIHHFEYGGSGVDVELHWSLGEHISYRIDRAAVLRDRTTHLVGGEQFNVPSHEHALLAHLLGAFRDIELGTCTLKPFLDLYFILAAMEGEA